MAWAGSSVQRWNASIWSDATLPLGFNSKTWQWPGGKGPTAALASAKQLSSVRPSQRQQQPIRAERQSAAGGARNITFGLRADAQEPVLGEDVEQRPDSEGVPAHADLPVGRVQQDESKDAVQQGRHLLGAEALVEVEQDLSVHLGLVLEAKAPPQLEEARQSCRQEPPATWEDVPPAPPSPPGGCRSPRCSRATGRETS